MRYLARLLWLEADTAASRGKWAQAANIGLDAVEFGSTIQQRGGVINKSNGSVCEAVGRTPIWNAVEHLSSGEAKAAIKSLQGILKERVTLTDSGIQQKSMTLSGLQTMMR